MQDNERLKELEMDSNRRRMMEINKRFKTAFWVCAVFPALQLFIGLLNIATALITLGLTAADPLPMFGTVLLYAAMIGAFIWSYLKDIRGTVAAILSVVVWCLIGLTGWGIDILLIAIALLWIGMQISCLKKYKELDLLKTQPGYPDFNSIYFHKTNSRVLSDEQVRESLRENKNAGMDDIFTDDTEFH